MPYYPEDQSEENLQKIRWANVCAECGRQLYIYMSPETLPSGRKRVYIACPTPGHEGIANKFQPADKITELRRSLTMTSESVAVAVQRRNLPMTGQLSKVQAMEVLKLVYPNVPEIEIIRTAILCQDFGLHPLLKEVYIIPFGAGDKKTWATVLGINATRKMMSRCGSFSYVDNTPRVMTEDEQKAVFGEVYTDRITAITKLRTKSGLEAQGYGHYMTKDTPYGTDKGNTKANMAFIRSERQAFSRLYPDRQLPDEVEIIDEAYAEVEGVGKVSTSTGEIIEVVVVEETPPPTGTEPGLDLFDEPTKPEPKQEQEVAGERDRLLTGEEEKELVALMNKHNMGGTDLRKWCNEQPRKWGIVSFRKDLKLWQFEQIKESLEKGKE